MVAGSPLEALEGEEAVFPSRIAGQTVERVGGESHDSSLREDLGREGQRLGSRVLEIDPVFTQDALPGENHRNIFGQAGASPARSLACLFRLLPMRSSAAAGIR